MAGKKMGRPSPYKPEYCEQVIEFMAKGNSGVQFAAHIGVCKDTISEWVKVHPNFSVAYKKAQSLCESHWEKIMQMKSLKKTEGSDACLIFWMKNRFRWNDRYNPETTPNDATLNFKVTIDENGEVHREEK